MRHFSVIVHLNTVTGWVNTLALAQLITQGSHNALTSPLPEPYPNCLHIISHVRSCLRGVFTASQGPTPSPSNRSLNQRCGCQSDAEPLHSNEF